MSKKLLTGIFIGAAVGTALGILFAPESGKDTRKKLAKKTNNLSDTVKEKLSELSTVVKEKLENIKNEANDIIEKSKAKNEEAKFS